jgi:hypothetical protein
MKNIKNLIPYFQTLSQTESEQKIIMRKSRALEKWMLRNFPNNIKGKYSFDPLGTTCIRCFIHLNKTDIDSTVNVCKWLPKLKKSRWEIEKFWREDDGYFSYRISRKYGYNDYILFFENTANIDGCVITTKEITKTVFVTDCEPERIPL